MDLEAWNLRFVICRYQKKLALVPTNLKSIPFYVYKTNSILQESTKDLVEYTEFYIDATQITGRAFQLFFSSRITRSRLFILFVSDSIILEEEGGRGVYN